MSVVATFPADFDSVQRYTVNAAVNAALDKEDKELNRFPKVFTKAHMLQGDATVLLDHAKSAIAKQMRSKSKKGVKLARASVRSVNAAINAAKDAIKNQTYESVQKATNLLNQANINIDKAWNYTQINHGMKTRNKGGTLRRKSVKRCKS